MHDLFCDVTVIPVLTIEREADAIPLAHALYDGGLPLIEVTLRTPAAPAAIAAITREMPQIIVGQCNARPISRRLAPWEPGFSSARA